MSRQALGPAIDFAVRPTVGGVGVALQSEVTGASIKTATLDFGTVPARVKSFTVTNALILAASIVNVAFGSTVPSGEPLASVDEWEMDPAVITARVAAGGGSMIVNVAFETPLGVVGKRSINYLIG